MHNAQGRGRTPPPRRGPADGERTWYRGARGVRRDGDGPARPGRVGNMPGARHHREHGAGGEFGLVVTVLRYRGRGSRGGGGAGRGRRLALGGTHASVLVG